VSGYLPGRVRKTSLSLYSQAQAWHARDLDECNAPTPVNKGPAGKELTCIGSEKKEFGITALYVTHDLREAAALGDRIAVIESGHLGAGGNAHRPAQGTGTSFVQSLIEDLDWDVMRYVK